LDLQQRTLVFVEERLGVLLELGGGDLLVARAFRIEEFCRIEQFKKAEVHGAVQ
jgi:hypothetical protein